MIVMYSSVDEKVELDVKEGSLILNFNPREIEIQEMLIQFLLFHSQKGTEQYETFKDVLNYVTINHSGATLN